MALPGASLKGIKTVKSHVQALSQCRNFLKKHRIAPLVHADTAGAAREIAEIGDKSVGAIASSLAARIYGLKVLARNIEDADHNTTRMLVFSRERGEARLAHGALHDRLPVPREERAGRALQGAGRLRHQRRQHREARELPVSGAHFEQAQFYAEVEGHPEQRGLQLALEELAFFSQRELKMLGTFPTHPFRRKGWDAPTRPGT